MHVEAEPGLDRPLSIPSPAGRRSDSPLAGGVRGDLHTKPMNVSIVRTFGPNGLRAALAFLFAHLGAVLVVDANQENGSFAGRLSSIIKETPLRTFARRAGVSETVLRKYVAGKSTPNVARLVAIASAGGVTVSWLATGRAESSVTESMTPEDAAASPVERFKATQEAYLEALEAVGWEPPLLIEESIRAAMFSHGLNQQGAIHIMDAIRRQTQEGQPPPS